MTGKTISRDSRDRPRRGPQPTPWPQGLLVEAPPSPKPWRGRTWSLDSSWRTSLTTTTLTGEDSSSQESLADWQSLGDGRLSDGTGVVMGPSMGIGVGALNETGIVGVRGVSTEIEDTASASSSGRRTNGTGSGGGRVFMNSDRDGSRVDKIGYSGCRKGRRDTYVGLTTTGPDINYPEAAKPGSPAKVDAGLGRGWPPLAPAPRVAAFPQPRRGFSGGGGNSRHVGMRTSPFAGLPFADTTMKRDVGHNATESKGVIGPKLFDERVQPSEAVPRWNGNDNGVLPVTCLGSNDRYQSNAAAASDVLDGGQGAHGLTRSVSRCEEESMNLKPVDAVSSTERGRDDQGAFEANPIKEITGFCGAEAAREADAAATGRMIVCDPVRMQPSRASVRHLHQFLFPLKSFCPT